VLGDIPTQQDPRILVDFRTSDDAGVYRWESGPALVQTVDFFTPIVDDPYAFGQIAAANSMSDVYAMGGRPVTALAIAGFPKEGLETSDIAAIFRGGFDKLREAGVALLGGHTVQDSEMKFGYAITGEVDPDRVLSNARARVGDVLLLTKPLGTGIIGTAIKFNRATPDIVEAAIASMTTLNRTAAEVLRDRAGIHSCTDITGFGLLGHSCEMAIASGVTLQIDAESLPLLPGARELLHRNKSGGLGNNREYFELFVEVADEVDPDLVDLAYDPQTSGGLLASVGAQHADTTEAALRAAGVPVVRIGTVLASTVARVIVR